MRFQTLRQYVATVCLLLPITTQLSLAADQSSGFADFRSIKVNISDLDPCKSDAQQTLKRRILQAAKRVCEDPNLKFPWFSAQYKGCIQHASLEAVEQASVNTATQCHF